MIGRVYRAGAHLKRIRDNAERCSIGFQLVEQLQAVSSATELAMLVTFAPGRLRLAARSDATGVTAGDIAARRRR